MLKCLIKWLNSQFAREKASQTDRGLEVEFGERPDMLGPPQSPDGLSFIASGSYFGRAPRGATDGERSRVLPGAGVKFGRDALAYLLAPHGVVEAFLLEQFFVAAGFDNLSALEHVDTVGVHDGR